MPFRIQPLTNEDIAEIVAIERESFSPPWPASAYRRELDNRIANYFVLREIAKVSGSSALPVARWVDSEEARRTVRLDSPILGYAGIWVVLDEAQLNTIAVREDQRGRGLADYLMVYAIECALDRGASAMTLEVRASNDPAIRLYEKFGFVTIGRRKNYYTDPREDAFTMKVDAIDQSLYRQRVRAIRTRMLERAGRLQVAR